MAAARAGCRRLWLITTNDNTPAINFYRHLGFSLVAIHEGAVNLSRRLKPEIPETGVGGVPIRDELEFEISMLAAGGQHCITAVERGISRQQDKSGVVNSNAPFRLKNHE